MVRFRLVDNRTNFSRKLKQYSDKLKDLKVEFLQELVLRIVLMSPVDTGTYMDAHNVGETSASTSSAGKPRKQPWQLHADSAISRLFNQIASLGEDSARAYISNNAEHAGVVEQRQDVYKDARASSEALFARVLARKGL